MENDYVCDEKPFPINVINDTIYDDSWRVKIFLLNSGNIWIDTGTALVSIIQQVSLE